MRRLAAAVMGLAAWALSAAAYAEKCPNMLILLDRSGSMQGFKWTTATAAINLFVPPRESIMRFGLMVFPGFSEDVCAGGSLRVSCDFFKAADISYALATSGQPGGYTPTAETLDQAGALPDMRDAARRRFIILLTDGDPTCPSSSDLDGNVQVTEASLGKLLSSGIKTFVIGFGQEVSPARLDRMAVAGGAPRANASCANPVNPTGPRIPCSYFDASDSASLNAALDEIASIAQGELKGNSCDDSCYGIGGCPEGQRCEQQVVTYAGGQFSLNLGQCVVDPCAGVTCAENQFCRESQCRAACTAPCPAGTYCQDGSCIADPCVGSSACGCSQTCAQYLVCLGGTCQDDPCRYVRCPTSAPYCDRGSCYAAVSPPKTEQPGSSADAGGGGGSKNGCSSAGAPGLLFWALALIPAALRRRAGRPRNQVLSPKDAKALER
ncbi:MAG: VWA domain-containing protein [Deltaproteobacteria bacterium]|nr:VWA domain-containing protein [Deltaproteobacteria bacterium]